MSSTSNRTRGRRTSPGTLNLRSFLTKDSLVHLFGNSPFNTTDLAKSLPKDVNININHPMATMNNELKILLQKGIIQDTNKDIPVQNRPGRRSKYYVVSNN